MTPIALGARRPSRRLSESRQWLGKHEDARRSLTFVFVVDTLGVLLGRGDWHAGLANKLHGLLVHAHHGAVGIVGFFVDVQHLFHVRDELAVRVGRDDPVFDFPLGHAVVFSVCRTVSGLMEATTSSSTSWSA